MALTCVLYVTIVLVTGKKTIFIFSVIAVLLDKFGISLGTFVASKIKHGHLKQNIMRWWIFKGNNEVYDFIF